MADADDSICRLYELKWQLNMIDPSGSDPRFQELKRHITGDLERLCPGPKAATVLLIEPRKHRAIPFLIKNALDNLDEVWTLLIVHGTENLEWLREILARDEFRTYLPRIQLRNLGIADLPNAKFYSDIVASRQFIEGIPTETFLIMQTDSMICPQHRHLIHKFLKYDYVGAPWPWDWLQVGNGGFSLRKKSKMLEILDRVGPLKGAYEDHFFAKYALYKPSPEEAREFSIEQVYHHRSFGVHKVWAHQLPERHPALKAQCDGLETLIALQAVD
jgi:Protein of unknown function (DUF5672)